MPHDPLPEAAASSRPLQSRDARHRAGQALRKQVPRSEHAEWTAPQNRPDPVAVLIEQGRSRIQNLLPVRYARMSASPFAFLRGAAAVMAGDLSTTPVTGPRVQSCGDCHLANFGTYASPEGTPVFDINDFDETLSAPFEWDLKRLGASLVLAGTENGASDTQARTLALTAIQTYSLEMHRLEPMTPLEIWADRIDFSAAVENFSNKHVRKSIQTRLQARMASAKDHFGLVSYDKYAPTLKEKPPLVMRLPEQDSMIRDAFARYIATQPPERAILLSHYRLQDVIFKVVGVGSVGTYCAIGLFATADGDTLLLQIKEAQTSVLAAYSGAAPFHNQGERVVTGQRIMQAAPDIFLGWTHTKGTDEAEDSAHLPSSANKQFYVRRLKDSRLAAIGADVAQEGLNDYARLCGRALARAHARSGDVAKISGYLGKNDAFADAVASFSVLYASQTKADWQAFTTAVAQGKIIAAAT